MAANKTKIYVYAHWKGMQEPKLIGILTAQVAKGKKAFSFEYDKNWIQSTQQRMLDPDIQFFSGAQYPNNKENFGIFLDSMPDTWGRTLMKRKAAQVARENNKKALTLYDIDFLLGVYDETRMGALRFKTNIDGSFLDDNADNPVPPLSSVRELQFAAEQYEADTEKGEIGQWLNLLIAPGSSLGGARPKANVRDEKNQLWIAKFPSKNDTINKAAWEFLAYQLANKAGINMSVCRIEKIKGRQHTFFTKRFDRDKESRIHFASAMTMTGNSEDTIRDSPASYLDIADFIQRQGAEVEENLHQLWRRIIFNIAISNTDDHLRNHGFILTDAGWILSPAYDLNPSIDKHGLALNIDMEDNALDFDLAKSVGAFFRLSEVQMNVIIKEVMGSVKNWRKLAEKIGISKKEQELMQVAFKI
ncbi:type II toxin-antitoxin system HipA family toxin [Arachidicoccus soli]|uniref:Type II toxin-antitoxin system HipA family toxin n=1 Tax=Arachidicoccus soli TaxID=2341117 RepID=A0A386HQD6_9BACT|nr:HipA domain-containing protein [Arachidicoccus soli]AYD47474.1 type II toxin-antitoxin system HipA family toxin [Arachidicoccus soli]